MHDFWWNEWTIFQSWKNQAFFDPETEKKDLEGALIHKRYKKDNKKFYHQYSKETWDKALNDKQVQRKKIINLYYQKRDLEGVIIDTQVQKWKDNKNNLLVG